MAGDHEVALDSESGTHVWSQSSHASSRGIDVDVDVDLGGCLQSPSKNPEAAATEEPVIEAEAEKGHKEKKRRKAKKDDAENVGTEKAEKKKKKDKNHKKSAKVETVAAAEDARSASLERTPPG